MGKKLFVKYLADFQQYIKNIGFGIDNQKKYDWLFIKASNFFGTIRYWPNDVR